MTTTKPAAPKEAFENGKSPAEEAVLKALSAHPDATAAYLAAAAGLGRSTACHGVSSWQGRPGAHHCATTTV